MRRESDILKRIRKRQFLVQVAQLSAFGILGARLFYLQLISGNKYKLLSDRNKTRNTIIVPMRGRLLDIKNRPLAANHSYHRIMINLESYNDRRRYRALVGDLVRCLELNEEKKNSILSKIKKDLNNGIKVISIMERVTLDDILKLNFYSYDLPNFNVERSQLRYYPQFKAAAHLIGYTTGPSEKDAQTLYKSKIFRHPDFKIGKYGIEQYLNNVLQGSYGIKQIEVNARGAEVASRIIKTPLPGKDIHTTIDYDIQEFSYNQIKDYAGSVVSIDLQNGGILSMCSSPSFDPDALNSGISISEWSGLVNDPAKPLMNKCMDSLYSPGSSFKIVTALTALESGVNPKEQVHCPGSYKFGGRTFHCWKKDGHGSMSMEEAIMHSCNVYFYHMAATRIEIDHLNRVAQKLGFMQNFHSIPFAQKLGFVPSEKWKKQKFDQPWYRGETLNIGIGQGYLQVTLLQLLMMISRVASGKRIIPYIFNDDSLDRKFLPLPASILEANPDHLAVIRKGLFNVVNQPGGTAYRSRIPETGMEMCGKTGTVQIISRRFETGDKVAKKYLNHGVFVGYAPAENPRYAAAALIENNGGGSILAAPIVSGILKEIQKKGKV